MCYWICLHPRWDPILDVNGGWGRFQRLTGRVQTGVLPISPLPTHTHTRTRTHTHTPRGWRAHTHTPPRGWPQLNYLLFQGQLDLWSVLPSLNTHPRESLTLSWDTVLWHVFKPVEERGRTALGQWRKEDGLRWANITRRECLPPNATLDPVLSGRNMFSQQSVI